MPWRRRWSRRTARREIVRVSKAVLPHGSIRLVGCGAMGGAILHRWIASGIDPARITVVDPGDPVVPPGVRTLSPDAVGDAGDPPDTLVLAIKPQQLAAVAAAMTAAGPLGSPGPRLLVSILAGVEEATLRRLWDAAAIVRAMPNLPVAIGRGVTALHASGGDAGARATAEALMRPLGAVEWIDDEALFDAVTALSGCGPGFVFRFIDALASAGAALGLPRDQAARLALATVEGAAAMAAGSTDTPAILADRVASPGGSTREGLNVLDSDEALERLLRETLAASAARNREMAAAARQSQ